VPPRWILLSVRLSPTPPCISPPNPSYRGMARLLGRPPAVGDSSEPDGSMEAQVSSSSLSPPPLASPKLGGRSRGATLRLRPPKWLASRGATLHLRPPRWADCSDLLDGVARGHGQPLHGGRRQRRPPSQAASAAPAGASPDSTSRGRDSCAATMMAPDSKDLQHQSKAFYKLTDHIEDLQLDSSQVQSISG
jgi:hypothetical protein